MRIQARIFIVFSCMLFTCFNYGQDTDSTAADLIEIVQQDSLKMDSIFFSGCIDANYKLVTRQNDFFQIDFPADWYEDVELPNGIAISSANFPDSLQRDFMLSVVPYKSVYMEKNRLINYFRFQSGYYNGYETALLTRNDLQPITENETVYWRSELRVLNKRTGQVYFLIFGRRGKKNEEPSWCEFNRIIKSLKILE